MDLIKLKNGSIKKLKNMNKFKSLLKSFFSGVLEIFTTLINVIIIIYSLPILLISYLKLLIKGDYKNSEFKFKLDMIKFIFKHLDSEIIIFTSRKVRARSYNINTGTYIDEEIKFKKEETLGES